MRLLILLLVFGLVLSGCLTRIGGSSSTLYGADYGTHLNWTPISDPSKIDTCDSGSCWCMICTEGVGIFRGMTNLIGSYCYFDQDCTATKVSDIIEQNDPYQEEVLRQFMVGQGPSFGDFAYANTFCENRLTMAVQWLIGSIDTPYTEPDPARAMCLLSKDIMPVYVLYSGGQNINISRTEDIATILGTEGDEVYDRLTSGPVGPVIVVTEMNADISQAASIADQVIAINDKCGNVRAGSASQIYCFTAIGVKLNDFATLDAIIANLSQKSALSKLDFVAYGIDGKYGHSCDGAKVRQQALNFSLYSLYTYGKPTVIPYVLFDPGTNDTDNSCTWDENAVVNAYNSFFPLGVQTMREDGVIGIAAYSFNMTEGSTLLNPLNCSNCAVGRTQERLEAWYGGCQDYIWYTGSSTNSVPSVTAGVIFGNASGSNCLYSENIESLFGVQFNGNDIFQRQKVEMNTTDTKYFSCDACVITNASNVVPFSVTGIKTSEPSDTYCSGYPEIDRLAGQRNLDPMLVRAFIISESDFNSCAAAKVCRAGDSPSGTGTNGQILNKAAGCFDDDPLTADECYSKGFNAINDPTGNCKFTNATGWDDPTVQPDWRWCGLGMMQSLEPPYTFWPGTYTADGNDGPLYWVFQISQPGAEFALAKACNPIDFNPFDENDSICVGTAKMEAKWADAKSDITKYHSAGYLNWDEHDNNKNIVLTAYITASKYIGIWDSATDKSTSDPRCPSTWQNGDCWAYWFKESWTFDDTYCANLLSTGATDTEHCDGAIAIRDKCYGYTDFIQYIRECQYINGENNRAEKKLADYFWLATKCPNSMCPDGQYLSSAMAISMPSSGTHYAPDGVSAPS